MHRCHGLKALHPNPISCRKQLFWEFWPLDWPDLFCHGMRTQVLRYGANLKKSWVRLLRRLIILLICFVGFKFPRPSGGPAQNADLPEWLFLLSTERVNPTLMVGWPPKSLEWFVSFRFSRLSIFLCLHLIILCFCSAVLLPDRVKFLISTLFLLSTALS